MRKFFFAVFFETYPCKSKKKNENQKNDPSSPEKCYTKKKCEYPLRQKKSYFWKICPSIHTHVLFPRHYNRTRFYQKNIDEITILHRNLVCFSSFFRITICKPNLIFQKCIKSDMKYPCKITFFFFVEITIYKANLEKNVYC